MSSLFKKRKNLNIIRQRVLDEDEEEELSSSNVKIPTKFEKRKARDKKEKKSTILSFEDDLEADDGIVFQEKKSSLSYKLKKEMKKERKEKKKEHKSKGEDSTMSHLDELGIKIINGREAEVIGMQPGDSDNSEDGQIDDIKPIFKSKKNREVQAPLEPWKAALQSGKIPDANLIHKIRKERQKARQQGDFIPLDDTVKLEATKSRLVREDDNDIDSEDESKIQFSINQNEIDKKNRREKFDAAQDSNELEHETNWELQQLRKAGAVKVSQSGEKHTNGDASMSEFVPGSSLQSQASFIDSVVQQNNVGQIGAFEPAKLEDYQPDKIVKRIKDSRNSLTEVFARHKFEAEKIIDDLVASKNLVGTCLGEKTPTFDVFKFFQDMRGYVYDLRDCLNEKMVDVKRLQDQVSLAYRQKCQNLVQRRRQDIKDQNNEFSPFSGKEHKSDQYRVRRASEREGRRMRRKKLREKNNASVIHRDGMSTDDEETTTIKSNFELQIEAVIAEREKIFSDVESEYCEVKMLMKNFEKWRHVDKPSYVDAYVSFNLPKILTPFISLELLVWNPLLNEKDGVDMEKMTWFNDLLFYGSDPYRTSNEGTSREENTQFSQDPDRRLISNVVEKVVLNHIKGLVQVYWDPLSHKQSVRLANLYRHCMSNYPSITTNSKHLKELTMAIMKKIKDSIENDVFIPMFPKTVYDSRTSGVSLFFQRQFWSAWKLLASVLMWHRILSDKIIHELAIRSLLNLYLLPALNLAAEISLKDALEKCRTVINVVPREWSKNEGGTHAFLVRIEDFLVTQAGKADTSKNVGEIKEICELLKNIGAKSMVKVINDKYL